MVCGGGCHSHDEWGAASLSGWVDEREGNETTTTWEAKGTSCCPLLRFTVHLVLAGILRLHRNWIRTTEKANQHPIQDIVCCVGVLIRDQQITHVKRFYWHGELLNYTKLCVGVELLFLGPSFVSRLNNVRVVLISDTHGPHARVPLRWIGLEWIMARVI